jgi:transcriptional regulator with XRE-family HTH domain
MLHMTTNVAPASPLAFGIASVLSDFKREHGLTGQEMAKMTKLDGSQISRWLNARRDITAGDLFTLLDGLGLDYGKFIETAQQRAREYEARLDATPVVLTPQETVSVPETPQTAGRRRSTPETRDPSLP